MSIASITINCDGCHVMEEIRWQYLDNVTLYLQRLGWEVVPVDEHYCPKCAQERRLRRAQAQKGENNA
jgi:hypothetical protein